MEPVQAGQERRSRYISSKDWYWRKIELEGLKVLIWANLGYLALNINKYLRKLESYSEFEIFYHRILNQIFQFQ